jgi:hypothetical protein
MKMGREVTTNRSTAGRKVKACMHVTPILRLSRRSSVSHHDSGGSFQCYGMRQHLCSCAVGHEVSTRIGPGEPGYAKRETLWRRTRGMPPTCLTKLYAVSKRSFHDSRTSHSTTPVVRAVVVAADGRCSGSTYRPSYSHIAA